MPIIINARLNVRYIVYTTIETVYPQVLSPFQCGSGSVATIVTQDRYACELCDAPVQPARCALYRENFAVL